MRSAKEVKANIIAYAKMVRALMTGSYSYEDLAEECGLSYGAVRGHVFWLRKERVVRVASWGMSKQNAPVVPMWTMCTPESSTNARKPPKKTMAQRTQAYRERKKETAASLQLTISRLHEPVQNVN